MDLGQIEDAYAKAKQLGSAPEATVVKYGPPFSLSRFFRAFGQAGDSKIELQLPEATRPATGEWARVFSAELLRSVTAPD